MTLTEFVSHNNFTAAKHYQTFGLKNCTIQFCMQSYAQDFNADLSAFQWTGSLDRNVCVLDAKMMYSG